MTEENNAASSPSSPVPPEQKDINVGLWFKSAVSGLWYAKREAAGDISAIRVEGVRFEPVGPRCDLCGHAYCTDCDTWCCKCGDGRVPAAPSAASPSLKVEEISVADLPFDDYCAGADCRNCKGINCTCPCHAPRKEDGSECAFGWQCSQPREGVSAYCVEHHSLQPAATPTPVVEQDAFADLLPLTAVRIAPGEYEIKSRDGSTLWRMEGAALADWVCASVSGYDAALRLAGVSPAPSVTAREAAEAAAREVIDAVWGEAKKLAHSFVKANIRNYNDHKGVESLERIYDAKRDTAQQIFNQMHNFNEARWKKPDDIVAIISRYFPVVVEEGDEATRLRWLLKQIISDLPAKRDWLDPELEREARTLTGSKSVSADAV